MTWWLDPEKVKQRKKNYENNFLKKHGVKNPQQLKEVKEKTNNTMRKKYGGVGFASRELAKKTNDIIEEKYGEKNIMKVEQFKFVGDKNPLRNPDIIKKVSNTLKGRPSQLKGRTYDEILGPKRAKERRKEQIKNGQKGWLAVTRPSIPQLELFKMVKEKYPTAVLEYPVLDYCLDIAVPELKLCFEYDGSYWHDPEKDKKRDEVLKDMGWKVTRYVDDLPFSI